MLPTTDDTDEVSDIAASLTVGLRNCAPESGLPSDGCDVDGRIFASQSRPRIERCGRRASGEPLSMAGLLQQPVRCEMDES